MMKHILDGNFQGESPREVKSLGPRTSRSSRSMAIFARSVLATELNPTILEQDNETPEQENNQTQEGSIIDNLTLA